MLEVRLARNEDKDSINILYRKVVDDLDKKKIDMLWGDVYPFCEVDSDIENKDMYVVIKDNNIVASFSLSTYDDPDYNKIKFRNNKKFIYLNRLVVDPINQESGIATDILKWIFNKVKKDGFISMRLTVYEDNIPAIILYEKNGFVKIEDGYYMIEDKKFIGYEKNKMN